MNIDQLKQLLSYDPDTGILTWIAQTSQTCRIGKTAGCLHHKGYVQIKIYGKLYSAHRLAFLYMTGKLPENEIDHINTIRNDNRWCNLREATRQQNCFNINTFNILNTKGVTPVNNKYQASITLNGKTLYLGLFDKLEDAKKAYDGMSKWLFGEFARS